MPMPRFAATSSPHHAAAHTTGSPQRSMRLRSRASRGFPGVARVDATRSIDVLDGGVPVTLRATTLAMGTPHTGPYDVSVDAAFAARRRLGVGDAFVLSAGGAPRQFRVVAIAEGDPLGRGAIALDGPTFARIFGSSDPDSIAIFARPDIDLQDLRARVLAALGNATGRRRNHEIDARGHHLAHRRRHARDVRARRARSERGRPRYRDRDVGTRLGTTRRDQARALCGAHASGRSRDGPRRSGRPRRARRRRGLRARNGASVDVARERSRQLGLAAARRRAGLPSGADVRRQHRRRAPRRARPIASCRATSHARCPRAGPSPRSSP